VFDESGNIVSFANDELVHDYYVGSWMKSIQETSIGKHGKLVIKVCLMLLRMLILKASSSHWSATLHCR